jgi:hypothetical protein
MAGLNGFPFWADSVFRHLPKTLVMRMIEGYTCT